MAQINPERKCLYWQKPSISSRPPGSIYYRITKVDTQFYGITHPPEGFVAAQHTLNRIILRPWFNLIVIWRLNWTIVWEYPHGNEGIKALATSSGSYHIAVPFLPCITVAAVSSYPDLHHPLDLAPFWLVGHNLDESAGVTVGKWIASATRLVGATNGSSPSQESNQPRYIPMTTKTMIDQAHKIGIKVIPWTASSSHLCTENNHDLYYQVFWCRIRVV